MEKYLRIHGSLCVDTHGLLPVFLRPYLAEDAGLPVRMCVGEKQCAGEDLGDPEWAAISHTEAYAIWFGCDFGAGEQWHGCYRTTNGRGPVVFITLSAPIPVGVALAVGQKVTVTPVVEDGVDSGEAETVILGDEHSANVFAPAIPGATMITVYDSVAEHFSTPTGFKVGDMITITHDDGNFLRKIVKMCCAMPVMDRHPYLAPTRLIPPKVKIQHSLGVEFRESSPL